MSESANPWEALERAVEQGRRYALRADHFKQRALAAEAKIQAVDKIVRRQERAIIPTITAREIRRALGNDHPPHA